MTEEWLQKSLYERLNSVEDKVSKLEIISHENKELALKAKENSEEILTMFKLQRWLVKGVCLVVGFGLWVTGQINLDQISSVVDTLSAGPK